MLCDFWGNAVWLSLVIRDTNIWSPEPLCQSPITMKLWGNSGHTKKTHTRALVSGLCRVKAMQFIKHRCQMSESRCWQKILRLSFSSHPKYSCFLSWGPRYQGTETSHPLSKFLTYTIHELNKEFFDASKFLDDLLYGKSNWINFLSLISPFVSVMKPSCLRKSPLYKEQLLPTIKSKGSWNRIRRSLH